MKFFFHQRPCPISEDDYIINTKKLTIQEELAQAKFALEIAYSGFENVTDPDLIDSYIYEVNAVLKRYKYLLEQAAKMNLLPEEEHNETYEALTVYS